MRKRLLSLILACIMLWCCMVPMLTGCNGGTPEDKYTVAEWLSKVEENFNMLYYTESEPLIQTVRSDSEYYDVVQIAAEWGLISAEDGLDFDKPVTKEFCADTLAKATNFALGETFDGIADADSITDKYVDGVNLALNEGIFKLDDNGKFDPKYEPTKEEADVAMVAARNAWTNFSFDGECFDKSVLKENVINLGGTDSENAPVVNSSYKVDYSGDLNVIGPDGEYRDNSTKTITFDAGQAPAMQVGTVLTMPGDDVIPMNYAVVVDSITENADGTVTVNTHNAQLGEVYDELVVRQSGKVDFSDAKFILPNGEIIDASSSAAAPMSNVGVNNSLSTREGRHVFADEPQKAVLADPKMKTVDLGDGLEVSFGVSKDTLAFSIHAEVEVDGIKYEVEVSESKSFDIEEDIDLKWGLILPKGIDRLYLALDIDTTEQLMLKVSGSDEIDFTPAKDTLEPDDVKSIYDQLSERIKKIQRGSGDAEKACNVKLFDVVIPNTSLHFTVKLGVSFEGTLTFTVEKHETYGVEYCGGNLRFIDENSEERTISFDGKIEAVLQLGLCLKVLGISIVDIGVEGGVGMTVSSKVYLKNPATQAIEAEFALPRAISDTSGDNQFSANVSVSGVSLTHPEIESCLETKVYPIVRLFACSSGTLANEVLGKNFEYEILGEDDPIAKIHYEGGKGIVDVCSKENAGDNIDIEVGDTVTANYDKFLMAKDETTNALRLLTIPKGIELKDVQITSSDPSVVMAANAIQLKEAMPKFLIGGNSDSKFYYKEYSKVDVDHFTLIGVNNGVATLTINAGGKTCEVQVVVGNGGIENVSEGRFVIKETSINLKKGEAGQVVVESAPEGYDLTQCTFSSTNTEIVTVDQNGNVTAGSKGGSAVIYITTNDGEFTGACMINVS